MSRSCVVVGAGVAGLAAAYRLASAGVRVTVLEGGAHIGGRVRTERIGDFVLNTGASLLPSFYHSTLSLLQELRLETVSPRKQPAIVATPFGKLPLDLGSTRALVRFPLLPWLSKLRALVLSTRLIRARAVHLADLASLARLDRGENAERWGRRALGEAGYHYLLRPAIEPTFFFGAEEASAALGKVLMRHSSRWELNALRGGIGTLCEALAERIEVRTGYWVGAVDAGPTSVSVRHSGGTVEADYAILACPASASARFDGSIPEADRKELESVTYAPNIALLFGYERPVTVQYPLVTAAGPGRHPVVGIWTMSHWIPEYVPEDKDLVCIHSSSWRAAELLGREPDKIVAALRADAEEIFGRLADPDWIRMYPREQATVVTKPGHFRRMLAFTSRRPQRILYAGDWITGSTVEGAVRTGLFAAARILSLKS